MKVNYSEENENKAVPSAYPEIKGYPHLFVLDADGKLLHSQFTGELEKGKGYDRAKFFAFLKDWAPRIDRRRSCVSCDRVGYVRSIPASVAADAAPTACVAPLFVRDVADAVGQLGHQHVQLRASFSSRPASRRCS